MCIWLFDWFGNVFVVLWFVVRCVGEVGGDGVVWCFVYDVDDIVIVVEWCVLLEVMCIKVFWLCYVMLWIIV